MARRYNRIPIPLILALAVAVGAAIAIILQVTALAPTPAVVAPIETPPASFEAGFGVYIIPMSVSSGSYANYPTLAGMGKLKLAANTSGWYYQLNDWLATVSRRSTGDAVFELRNGYRVYVREVNDTHAVVLYTRHNTAVVTAKVQVGNTGWIVYHPVVTAYDGNILDTIVGLMNDLGYTHIYVFQPKHDYLMYDPSTKTFYVYFDVVEVNNGVSVHKKQAYFTNTTSFIPVPVNYDVTVDGIERIDSSNYVLYSVWALFYYPTLFSFDSMLAIAPTR
jgi:hypothetical protein